MRDVWAWTIWSGIVIACYSSGDVVSVARYISVAALGVEGRLFSVTVFTLVVSTRSFADIASVWEQSIRGVCGPLRL